MLFATNIETMTIIVLASVPLASITYSFLWPKGTRSWSRRSQDSIKWQRLGAMLEKR